MRDERRARSAERIQERDERRAREDERIQEAWGHADDLQERAGTAPSLTARIAHSSSTPRYYPHPYPHSHSHPSYHHSFPHSSTLTTCLVTLPPHLACPGLTSPNLTFRKNQESRETRYRWHGSLRAKRGGPIASTPPNVYHLSILASPQSHHTSHHTTPSPPPQTHTHPTPFLPSPQSRRC